MSDERHTRTHVDGVLGPSTCMVTLRWRVGPERQKLRVDERAVIGSAPGAQLHVDDDAVSRLHAEIVVRGGEAWIHDLGSRNGTFVDDLMVTGARLRHGALVRVGRTTIGVSLKEEPLDAATAVRPALGALHGPSAAMQAVFARLERVAPTDSTVLLLGETGTGKDLVARTLHELSPRASGPFVVVDCGAIPERLIDAELFGHARGAFTGAGHERAGALEEARGGTVFLDEIGELSPAVQPKLLRAIETRSVKRLGESAYRPLDVRFVAATHRNLESLVNLGAFREDLYFRLAVVPIELPALRARREDLPGLVERFAGPRARELLASPRVRQDLDARPWLGNVRELRNYVERLLALGVEPTSASPPGEPSAIPDPYVDFDATYKANRDRVVDALERRYLSGLIQRHGRNVSAIARASGLDRTWVHRLVRKHEL